MGAGEIIVTTGNLTTPAELFWNGAPATYPGGAVNPAYAPAPGVGEVVIEPERYYPDFQFDQIGNYVFYVEVDTPINAAADEFGVIPERVEVTNNILSKTIYLAPDASPWRDPRGENYIELGARGQVVKVNVDIAAPSIIQYGTEASVTARIFNYGNLTLPSGTEVLLTSEYEGILGVLDSRTTVAPIDPRGFEDVTLSWTPGHDPAEVRLLKVEVDRQNQVSEAREDNNTTRRELWMDLSPWKDRGGPNYGFLVDLDIDQAPQYGDAPTITAQVFNRGPLPEPLVPPIVVIPNNAPEGIVSLTGERLYGPPSPIQTETIATPSPGSPQTLNFTWDLDPSQPPFNEPNYADNPIQSVKVFVDASDYYAENDETNNITTRPLPDLVVSDIRLDGIAADIPNQHTTGDILFLTANAGGSKAMPVGTYYLDVKVTPPPERSGAYRSLTLGPFTGPQEIRVDRAGR